jgi:transcriptional activator SPT8
MPTFDDDDDRDLGGSQDGHSEDYGDETLRDVDDADADGDGDGDMDPDQEQDDDMDGDGDGDGEGDVDGDGDDDDDDGDSQQSDNEDQNGEPDSNLPDATQQSLAEQLDASRDAEVRRIVLPEMLTASTYDIVPTMAAPMSTSVNSICATFDTRWVFTGGTDGYIRKYNWVDTVNNKLALTVAQRHPFVDSVVKAGVLISHWENWDVKPRSIGSSDSVTSQVLSPVYSLACQSQALWLLAGTASGAIRLQSIRHDEGKEIALLKKHTSAVSILSLSSDERSLLSGSWDKTVLDWDLETGKVRTNFAASASQISCIESRPISSLPVPAEAGETVVMNGAAATKKEDTLTNGIHSRAPSPPATISKESPDSLFGGDEGDDDLFGDDGAAVMGNGTELDAFGEVDEMQSVIANGPPAQDAEEQMVVDDSDQLQPVQPPSLAPTASSQREPHESAQENGVPNTGEQPLANGMPHADLMDSITQTESEAVPETTGSVTSDSTFLATSIDGAIRIWDRRQPNPVARITPRNTPPWCLSACWSPDGNSIYAGRRNNTVEEYDLRKGLKAPDRVFRFPNGSGAVTAVRAMPNGRHLVCASFDILRLYDLKESNATRSTVPFLIVPGHRTGVISQLYIDPACRFMMSTGGNRGWEGTSTEVLLGYEIAAA